MRNLSKLEREALQFYMYMLYVLKDYGYMYHELTD